ncbi:P-loop containing nucleoside triphosphate hydrolase protein [Parasitella parasitica]|nr:P-loop containing nucleoside triphosphate hydrolase protein [Parasitella parasitica]
MSTEDLDKLDEGLAYVYSVIGDDTILTSREIKEALWYYYFDREETVNWALEHIAKEKALEEKKKAKEEAKKAAAEKKAAATAASAKAKAKAVKAPKEEAVEFLSDQEDISQEMDAMGLGSKTAATKSVAATEPFVKVPASKRVNVAEEYQKRSGEKPKLNLVVIGHVDAGKSTLMGHFLYDLGQVNERTMRKFERESQKIGKGSFAYAWVLDETGEERDRGITMDIATNHFETEHRQFTLLDAPGHRDFIPNMISGTAQADAAILVVDASTNAFEAGFDAGGQTKEHAVLARSLGVQQLIVAINKLDMTDWSQERFKEIEAKLGAYLYQVGFRKSKVVFVPVSGLTGENLVKRSQISQLTSWYNGPSLMEQIDKFDAPVRLLDKPLRMRVTDFFKGGIGSSGGVSVSGNIESGTLQIGEQIMIVPGNEVGFVKTMQVNEEPATWAAAGDSVLMTLVNLDIMNLSNGCVLCTGAKPVPVTTTFEAQIVVFDIRIPITPGYPIVLHHGSLDEPASVMKLVEIIDKATGQVTKRNPRCLTKGMTAKIQIKLAQRPIPLETFKDNKHLGRIMLRKDGETVAAGVVNEILTFGS